MKAPSLAPFFGVIYPGLCDVARAHGYALALHGTLTADLDLIAVPWTEDACSAEELRNALLVLLHACDFEQSLIQFGLSSKQAADMAWRAGSDKSEKPHGRVAWNLYLGMGCKIDLSVMPRLIRP